MYRVYGSHPTRTTRVLWALEEIEAPYEVVHVNPSSDKARAVNPSGKVPALEVVMEGFRLIDSTVILQFLADRHPAVGLTFAQGSRERAEMDSWIHFAISDLELPVWTMSKHSFIYPDSLRAPDVLKACAQEWNWGVDAMDARLGDGPYLVGEPFTVPDIIMGHVSRWAGNIGLEAKRPHVVEYFERVLSRPALARAVERGEKECPR